MLDLINKPYIPFTVEFGIPTNLDELVSVSKKILGTDYCPRTMELELAYRQYLNSLPRGLVLQSIIKDITKTTGKKFEHGCKDLAYNKYSYDLLFSYLPDVVHSCFWVYDDTPQKEIDRLLEEKLEQMQVTWAHSFYNPTIKKSVPEIQHKQVYYIL